MLVSAGLTTEFAEREFGDAWMRTVRIVFDRVFIHAVSRHFQACIWVGWQRRRANAWM